MNDVLDAILGVLNFIYGERWVVPFVFVPIMFACAYWVRRKAIRSTLPYLTASKARIEAIREALGANNEPVEERQAFADNYIDVSTAMKADGKGSHNLVLAWLEFQESMVDEDSTPIRNTNRPGAFFQRVAPKMNDLTFASNIFVGVGLILTFLGLIVALNTAAQGMSGGDVDAAKASLQGLLIVAGAKFFTSVAGLGASIWLRFTEHKLTKLVRRETDLICELLERGLLYVSPQRLAVEQLEVLREQRDQLKFFNTDVALQLSERIGAQFTQAIAPVSASLSLLNDNMTAVTQGIGAGAKEAIEKVSGDQLRGLSETLGTLSGRLDAVSQTVGNSSDDAARQIRIAGEDFTKAAADIREAFDRLTGQVDGMGSRFSEQGEAASAAQKKALENIMNGIETTQTRSTQMVSEVVASLRDAGADTATTIREEVGKALRDGAEESQRTFRGAGEDFAKAANDIRQAFDRLTTQVDGMGSRISEQGETASAAQKRALEGIMAGIDTAQARSSRMVGDVVETLRNAGADAAGTMQEEVSKALKSGVEESQRTFRIAVEESGEALRETAGELSKAVAGAADQVERASVGFSQSGDKAAETANAMRSVTDNARIVAISMGEAAQGFAKAAGPVADAAKAVDLAATRIALTVENDRAADTRALGEMKELSEAIRGTQAAAEEAWRDYRARFEGVDRALSDATEKLAETLGDSLTQFRQFAQDTDREMASAVSRLGNTMTQIEEYAESLDDYVEEARGLREAAE